MNEKKSNGFAALILSVVVALVAVFGVKFAGGSASVATPAAPDESVAAGESQGAEAAGRFVPGTYTAQAQGMGVVTVTLTVDANAITDLQIDGPNETDGIGSVAIEKLQPAVMEAQSAEVDTVASATITSNAVISAVQDCLTQASSGAEAGDGAAASAGKYVPGTYTAEETGMGKVTVTITVGDDGNISDVQIDGPGETAGIGSVAIEKLQPAIMEAQSAEVDAIASATITSNAVIKAAQACLAQAAN